VLRRVFGSKREEVTGDRRNLHNEERHDFYSSPNNVKSDYMKGGPNAKVWYKKLQEMCPLWRHRHRWEVNIKMDLKCVKL
jgi:hypothetical protein